MIRSYGIKDKLLALIKSTQHTGEVQVEKTVTRDGTTFIEKYWTTPERVTSDDHVVAGGCYLHKYHQALKHGEEYHGSDPHSNYQDYHDFRQAFHDLGEPKRDYSGDISSYGKWVNSLTADEREAIHDYTGRWYEDVNNYLRGRPIHEENRTHVEHMIPLLDSAISKFHLDRNLMVHREVRVSCLDRLIGSEGGIFLDNGFFSTTVIKGSYESDTDPREWISLTVKVPSGKGIGAWVSPISAHRPEFEFLIARGTRFMVDSMKVVDGKYHLEMTVIESEVRPMNEHDEIKKSIDLDHSHKFEWDMDGVLFFKNEDELRRYDEQHNIHVVKHDVRKD